VIKIFDIDGLLFKLAVNVIANFEFLINWRTY